MPNTAEQAPEFQAATLDQWARAAAKSAPAGNLDALTWVTPEGLKLKPLYTAAARAHWSSVAA